MSLPLNVVQLNIVRLLSVQAILELLGGSTIIDRCRHHSNPDTSVSGLLAESSCEGGVTRTIQYRPE